MPPAILDATRAFQAQLRASEGQARAVMLRRWLEVEAALQTRVEATVERIADLRQAGRSIHPNRIAQLDRYQDLVRQSRREINRYVDNVAGPVTLTRQTQLADMGVDHAIQAQRVLGIRAQFNRLPREAIETLTGIAGDGTPLSDLLRDSYGTREADAILQRMITGVARGQHPRVIARDVVRRGYSQSLTRMMATMRTEPARAYHESSRQQYQRSGVVIGYRRLATLDERTCIACLASDGRRYDLNEQFDAHVNCRCAMIPILGDDEPDWELGQQWFERQEPVTQRRILGDGKYDLWQSGQVQFSDFAATRRDDVWGNSVVPATIQELVGG